MCDTSLCEDVHAIKTITDDLAHQREHEKSNGWLSCKNIPFFLSLNCSDYYFESKNFGNGTIHMIIIIQFGSIDPLKKDRPQMIHRCRIFSGWTITRRKPLK
jgi:hypothetical protein